MGRPRKFQERDVVALAGEAFSSNGYGGTTMDDLVRATGIGKQSLYNAFEGKRELFLRALTSDAADAVAAVDEALGSDRGTPLERIRAHLLKLAITFSAGSSKPALLMKATVELADRDTDVAHSALHAFQELRAIYRSCLADAQASGELAESADLDGLASFFLVLTRGMEVIGQAGISRAELTSIAMAALDNVVAANEPTSQPPDVN
ncbi:transcriptional regulator, TetR family [Arthrobacter sp. ok909]|uniref:TetR/AcrR family transcriptional regulator n=1 Tax=Arthrobacter sp. ok909 TaxID=1761746 RepID=UPI0008815616|nr:TetR/AcrR family transcriptional regulator [Arthrobacter sp. ok909]SDP80227.1 transcriptional regulator, TetR family [Arthrobacter sp. ok909]